ncbi:MAG TPA: FtsW/RodA/SpoVE family cell cycle protein [Pirellulales bacterium]
MLLGRQLPWSIPIVAGLLFVSGVLGIARCEEIASTAAGSTQHQIVWSVLAVVAMALAATPNYRLLGKWSYWALAVATACLLAVYLFPQINGAHRWIRLARVGFQPSEFAKLAVVLALARYLAYRDSRQFVGLLAPLAMTVVPLWLVLKEPDLGTSLVLVPVLFAMLLAAGGRKRHLVALSLLGLAALPALWNQMSRDQRSRVAALWQQNRPEQAPTPGGYHLHQAKAMFALGGFWGSALDGDADAPDEPIERRVPEAQTDSIFCVIGERYGIAGCGIVLGLYAFLVSRGFSIAGQTREPFGRLVVVGVMATIAFQVIINTGMLVGLLPITGVPLPLVSYGGSGLIANAIALGLVINVGSRPGFEIG